MIRWKYLVPRLIILSTVTLFLVFGLSPLARWTTVFLGTSAVGARVDVEGVDVSLARMDVTVDHLTIANPSSPMTNLIEIGQARLDVDAEHLAHRRLVVREGVLTGIRFASPRDLSGAVPLESEEEAEEDQDSRSAERVLAWLSGCGDRLQEDLESELQTPGVCRELMRRWPEEYRQLEMRTDDVRTRVNRLRRVVERMRQGKLSTNPKDYQRLAEDLQAVRAELEEIPSQVRRLGEQVQDDRQAVEAARQHDLAYAKERLRLDALDPQELTRYLLAEEQAERVEQLVGWLHWIRQYIPVKRSLDAPQRGRGRTLVFGVSRRSADWVFEHLAIDGEAVIGGERYEFAGQLQAFTFQQTLYGVPTQLSIETGGEYPLAIEATFDRRTDRPTDQLLVRCPALQLPERSLGDESRLALNVPAASTSVELQMQLVGEELSGRFVMVQPNVRLQASLSDQFGGAAVQSRVNAALSAVDQVGITLTLDGTLRHPRWNFESNLGSDLALGLRQTVGGELQAQADRLVASIDRRVERHLEQLEQLVSTKTEELADRIRLPREEVDQLAKLLPGTLPLGDPSQLPEMFRTGQLRVPDWLRR